MSKQRIYETAAMLHFSQRHGANKDDDMVQRKGNLANCIILTGHEESVHLEIQEQWKE